MSISNTEKTVNDIHRKTRRKHSIEEKIHIVLEGLRGEISIAEVCRRIVDGGSCSLLDIIEKLLIRQAKDGDLL